MKIEARTIADEYRAAKNERTPYEQDWREISRLILPNQYGGWQSPDSPAVTAARGARASSFDATGSLSLLKFVALCNYIATPAAQVWHGLQASNKDLMRIRAVDIYFEDLQDCLFRYRYEWRANFVSTQLNKYLSLGAYGPGIGFVGVREPTKESRGGPVYKNPPLRDVFLRVDSDGQLSEVFRRLRPNARQARKMFKDEDLPKAIRDELDKPTPSETKRFEICHFVGPRDDYTQGNLDSRRYPIVSCYVSVEGADSPQFVGEPSGYFKMPYTAPTNFAEEDNPYGYSPAAFAYTALQGASAMKKTVIKQGQKAADPVLLAADDGVLGQPTLVPGSVNYGAMNAQGKELLKAMPVGDFQIAKELIQDERGDIRNAFMTQLFEILEQHPEMSAAEVWDRIGKETTLTEPVSGVLQNKDLGPMIDREIDIIGQLGLGPQMPPELQEARGEYTVLYTTRNVKQQRAEEVASFFRLSDAAANVAKMTGDTKPLRRLDFDTAMPEIADILGVTGRWLHSDDEVAAMEKQAQQQQQVSQLAEAAPAIAGMAKAAAASGGAKQAA